MSQSSDYQIIIFIIKWCLKNKLPKWHQNSTQAKHIVQHMVYEQVHNLLHKSE